MTTTTVETLTRAAEHALKIAPNLESVVLFGSRARGTARADSDWDVALVAKGKPEESDPAYDAFDDLERVNAVQLTLQQLGQNHGRPDSAIPALVKQGICLAGHWNPSRWCTKEMQVDADTLREQIRHINQRLKDAVVQQGEAVRLHQIAGTTVENGAAAHNSARAAELLAKLVLGCHGEVAREVHDLNALAWQLKHARHTLTTPEEKARFSKAVQALNGKSRKANEAEYAKDDETLETPAYSARRIMRTIEFQEEWLAWYLTQRPQTQDTVRTLETTIAFFATEAQENRHVALLPRALQRSVRQWRRCAFASKAPTVETHDSGQRLLVAASSTAARLTDPDMRTEAREKTPTSDNHHEKENARGDREQGRRSNALDRSRSRHGRTAKRAETRGGRPHPAGAMSGVVNTSFGGGSRLDNGKR